MTHFCLLDLSHLRNYGYQKIYQEHGNDDSDDVSDDGNGVDDDCDHQVGDVFLDIGDLASKRREDCQEFEHLLLSLSHSKFLFWLTTLFQVYIKASKLFFRYFDQDSNNYGHSYTTSWACSSLGRVWGRSKNLIFDKVIHICEKGEV